MNREGSPPFPFPRGQNDVRRRANHPELVLFLQRPQVPTKALCVPVELVRQLLESEIDASVSILRRTIHQVLEAEGRLSGSSGSRYHHRIPLKEAAREHFIELGYSCLDSVVRGGHLDSPLQSTDIPFERGLNLAVARAIELDDLHRCIPFVPSVALII